MENECFFFIQMSDLQFGMFPNNGDEFKESQLFEIAITHINRLVPAFMIHTGDLVNDPCDEKQLSASSHTMQKLNQRIPLYTIPGNHDIGDSPTRKTLSWYRKSVGKDWYSFDYHQWHFIGLNSCIIAHGEHVSEDAEEQWDWLNLDLEQAISYKKRNIVVFMHHPPFLKNPEEIDDYFNIPAKIRRIYLDLFQKYGIKTILAGHLHQNNVTTDSQLEVITTGPVGMPLGSAFSGFRIIKVYSDFIKHKYFGLHDKINHNF